MQRLDPYKLIYPLTILAGGGALVWLTWRHDLPWTLLLLVAALLLAPGRIAAHFYRDFFQGVRALERGRPRRNANANANAEATREEYSDLQQVETALAHFRAFEEQLRAHPWRKALVWLLWGVSVRDRGRDVEAMSKNNAAAALHLLARYDEARRSLKEALALDPAYDRALFNLAVNDYLQGDPDAARRSAERLHELRRGPRAKRTGRGDASEADGAREGGEADADAESADELFEAVVAGAQFLYLRAPSQRSRQ